MSIDGNYFGTYLAFKLLFHVKAVKFSIKYFMLEKKMELITFLITLEIPSIDDYCEE